MRNWALQVLSMELRKAFSYRVDFWLTFLSRVFIIIGVAYFLWTSIYALDGRTEIGGFTLSAMLAFFTILPITERIVLGEDLENIAAEIYEGSLTKYLIYPVPYFRQKYLFLLARSMVSAVQYFLIYAIAMWAFRDETSIHLSFVNACIGLVFSLFAGVTYFSFKACIEQIAFWADNVWSLSVMLRFTVSFLGGGLVPLELFPENLRNTIEYTPFPYLLSMPIQLALGRVEFAEAIQGSGILLAWTLLAMGLVKVIWRRGLKQYSGVGL